jgi:hypothetical protein
MVYINVFSGVGVAGDSWTLHVPAAAAAAHPAYMAQAAAAISPQRKRRTATATGPSVDRGPI